MLECVRRASTVVRAPTKTGQNCVRTSRVDFLLILFLALLCVRSSTSGGLQLGAHMVCARVAGLTDKQRAMCRSSPAAIAAIGDGLRMAYEECRVQLAGHRWNCSGVGDGNDFGHVMPLGTREAAFTYAITSAGVTHALSSACSRGDLPACGCTASSQALDLKPGFDCEMSEMVKDLVKRECKCHGVSGSCALRTCWRALPQFEAVAKALRDKYQKAKLVTSHPPPTTHAPHTHLVIRRSKQHMSVGRQPRKSELVFLSPSPSYCEPDPGVGSLGTHGRHCNRSSRGEDGCETLCCGRGYNTLRAIEETKCRCQFHWCCRVTCDTCLTHTETHVCN